MELQQTGGVESDRLALLLSNLFGMKSTKPNPLYAKRPGESQSDHMKRLHAEFPNKFHRKKGSKNRPKEKFTAADLKAAEDRAVKEALDKIKTQAPAVSEKPIEQPKRIEVGEFSTTIATPDTQLFSAGPPPAKN